MEMDSTEVCVRCGSEEQWDGYGDCPDGWFVLDGMADDDDWDSEVVCPFCVTEAEVVAIHFKSIETVRSAQQALADRNEEPDREFRKIIAKADRLVDILSRDEHPDPRLADEEFDVDALIINEELWGSGSAEVVREWLTHHYNPEIMPRLLLVVEEDGPHLCGWHNRHWQPSLIAKIFGEGYAVHRLDQVGASLQS